MISFAITAKVAENDACFDHLLCVSLVDHCCRRQQDNVLSAYFIVAMVIYLFYLWVKRFSYLLSHIYIYFIAGVCMYI